MPVEIIDEGNNLVYVFDDEYDVEEALAEADGDVGSFSDIEWVVSRRKLPSD